MSQSDGTAAASLPRLTEPEAAVLIQTFWRGALARIKFRYTPQPLPVEPEACHSRFSICESALKHEETAAENLRASDHKLSAELYRMGQKACAGRPVAKKAWLTGKRKHSDLGANPVDALVRAYTLLLPLLRHLLCPMCACRPSSQFPVPSAKEW